MKSKTYHSNQTVTPEENNANWPTGSIKTREVQARKKLTKRTIRVSASFGGKIATGPYQNMAPSFFAEVTSEIPPEMSVKLLEEGIKIEQQKLQEICRGNFDIEARKAKIQKIAEDRKDFRWYGDDISVTSFLGYDADFYVNEDELKQYASQGNIIHAQVSHYINSGQVWPSLDNVGGIGADIFIINAGSLKLSLEGWNFPAFVEKYKLTKLKNSVTVHNDELKYAGTPDFECIHGGVPTLCDVKRTPDKVKHFMQIAAYAKCKGLEHIQKLMVVPINDKTEQGFSKPLETNQIDRYFDLVKAKRKEFKRVYGI